LRTERPILAIEPIEPIEPIDTIDLGRFSVSPKQNEHPSVAEPSPLVGQIAQLRPQLDFRRSRGPIAYRLAVGTYDLAGPPFRKAPDGLQVRDSVTPGGRPYH
jgi:hypothetical protein